MGETREDRLREFLEENDAVVVGLREGSWLRREGPSLRLEGLRGARIFRRNREPEEAAPGDSLDGLMGTSGYRSGAP
jgi:dipeptidase E